MNRYANRPLVTVVVPCHNAAPWLDQTIRLVRAQEFADWELRLVDDGSADGSVAVAGAHAAEDERIHVIHLARAAGGAAARNRAIVGDSGSTMLGFAAAWFAIELAFEQGTGIPPVVIAWILALPIFDTISLMLRRMLKGQSPMAPDREHLHHIFERAGFSHSARPASAAASRS